MSDIKNGSVDDGAVGFGGEKLKQHQAQANALPDAHANSTGHETRDDDIVAAEFGGLDNDLVDMSSFVEGKPDDDGLGAADEDEDDEGLVAETKEAEARPSPVSEYDRSRDA